MLDCEGRSPAQWGMSTITKLWRQSNHSSRLCLWSVEMFGIPFNPFNVTNKRCFIKVTLGLVFNYHWEAFKYVCQLGKLRLKKRFTVSYCSLKQPNLRLMSIILFLCLGCTVWEISQEFCCCIQLKCLLSCFCTLNFFLYTVLCLCRAEYGSTIMTNIFKAKKHVELHKFLKKH